MPNPYSTEMNPDANFKASVPYQKCGWGIKWLFPALKILSPPGEIH